MNKIREILGVVEEQLPELYTTVEKRTSYPDQDDFVGVAKYDEAVDRAEFTALIDIMKEELDEQRQEAQVS